MPHARRRGGGPALALLAALAPVIMLMSPGGAVAGTDNVILTVNLTSDEPDANTADNVCDADLVTNGAQCTLRAAIEQANAYAGMDADLIRFGIPGNGVHRIAPSAYLPNITGPTVIDGYTQPGASVNELRLGRGDNAEIRIELNGRKLDQLNGNGLRFGTGSSGSAVKGLCINRFATGLVLESPTTVAGNFIGTDATGTRDRGNTFDGIFASLLGVRTIGGPDPAARNVISANGRAGIVSNAQATVQGNYIGTASDGVSPLGNRTNPDADAAVVISSNSINSVVGGLGNAANVIAFNGGKGIALINSNTVAQLRHNRIFGNDRLAIDLGDDGRSPNDPDDADAGPNRLLNFPVLKGAVAQGGQTKITGVLKTFPAPAPYGIELFANPPHTRQARRFIGFLLVDTNGNGKAEFTFKAKPVAPGKTITATATDDGGATSELSAPVRVGDG
jgi:trimeric autotransporter adhesin